MAKGSLCSDERQGMALFLSERPEYAHWLDETNSEILIRGLGQANSYPERIIILHRLAQLKPIQEDDPLEKIEVLNKQIEDLKIQLTKDAEAAMVSWNQDRQRDFAAQSVLGSRWKQIVAQILLENHPEYKQLSAQIRLLHESLDSCSKQETTARGNYTRAKNKYGQSSQQAQDRQEILKLALAETASQKKLFGSLAQSKGLLALRLIGSETNWSEAGHGPTAALYKEIEEAFEAERQKDSVAIQEKLKERRLQWTQNGQRNTQDRISYVESQRRVLLNHHNKNKKLRDLLDQPVKFEDQDLSQIKREVNEHQGDLRAVFVEDSLFNDDLFYSEHSTQRVARPINQITISSSGLPSLATIDIIRREVFPDSSPMGLNIEILKALKKPISPISVDKTEPTHQDVLDHIKEHLKDSDILTKYPDKFPSLAAKLMPFYEDPAVKSTQAWADSPEPVARSLAWINPAEESKLTRILQEYNATVSDNPLEVPSYRSWADVQGGKRFSLEVEPGCYLHYVPHYETGKKEVTDYEVKAELTIKDNPTLRSKLEEVLKARYQQEKKGLSDLAVIEHIDRLSPSKAPLSERLVQRIGLSSFDKENIDRDSIQGFKRLRSATPQDLEKSSYWGRFQDGWLQSRPERPINHRSRMGAYELYQDDLKGLEQLTKRKKPLKIIQASRTPVTIYASSHKRYKLEEDYIWAGHVDEQKGLRAASRNLLKDPEIMNMFSFSDDTRTYQEGVTHLAPFSERGNLTLEGADPGKSLEIFRKLGLCKKSLDQVPYDLVYRSSERRRGRVHAQHSTYASRKESLKLPGNYMVLHGMTGAEDSSSLLKRFGSIVESNGLKSIAERRRMNVGVVTLSPLGDIASGIDQGVPCKIGTVPSYGQGIFFGLKPEVLERRDLWFSDKDYGGGKDRYEHYTRYARKIGQKKIHQEADHNARQKHLDQGVQKHYFNEVYFKHEINWDEIDTVFVDKATVSVNEIEEIIAAAKQSGKIPKELRIQSFEKATRDTKKCLTNLIEERSKDL